ncbi:hypothetical protein ACWC5C_02930 [Streptomyces sp. NPDC001700]
MTHADPATLRRALADRLEEEGVLKTPAWRKAIESVPRELFLPSFFNDALGPDGITQYTPVTRAADADERLALVYRNETWVTQLDGHLTADTGDRHRLLHGPAVPPPGRGQRHQRGSGRRRLAAG